MSESEPRYGGIVNGIVNNLLHDYGISKDLVKKTTEIIEGVVDNVEVQQIGDETFVTIHINKINFKFKKGGLK